MATIEQLQSRIDNLERSVSVLSRALTGGGSVINFGKQFKVDVSCALSEIYNLKHKHEGPTHTYILLDTDTTTWNTVVVQNGLIVSTTPV